MLFVRFRSAFLLCLCAYFVLFAFSASAQTEHALAQSPPVQKALEKVEESVQDLVTARDENIVDDLAFRIDAFKKVLELSLSEAKDLKVRALLIEPESKELEAWRAHVLEQFDEAVRHFEALQKKGFSHIKDIEAVKVLAQDFRAWREIHYLPAVEQLGDFFIVEKGFEVVAIAKTRSDKVGKDVEKLLKTNIQGVHALGPLFESAREHIAGSMTGVQSAEALFAELYIQSLFATSSSQAPTSTLATASSSMATSSLVATSSLLVPTSSLPIKTSTTPALTSDTIPLTTSTTPLTTSTLSTATSTPPVTGEEDLVPSIKDLVRASFDEVKAAYQVFIEMSSLVRKLL